MQASRLRLSPWQLGILIGVVIVWTCSVMSYAHAKFQERQVAEQAISKRVTRLETGGVYVEKLVTENHNDLKDVNRKLDELMRFVGVHRHVGDK